MHMKVRSHRLDRLADQFFAVLDEKILAIKAAGHDVIRLDIGSPDRPPADFIVQALVESAARHDQHGYQSNRGTPGLRAAWAEMYRRDQHVFVDPDTEVVPLLGSKEGIFHLMLALLDPGDMVLIPDPGYITYTQGTICAGAEPFYLPLRQEAAYLPDLDSVPPAVLKRARMLWLNYPNNPTAATATLEFFARAVEFARQNNLLLCHDAAYIRVTYDGYRAISLLETPGAKEAGCIEFNSVSKTYNMAGWRVGAAVGNSEALKSLLTFKSVADSSHFRPVMDAATAALLGDQSWLAPRNEVYARRRDLVLQGLQPLGLQAERPKASLYIWFQVPPGWTSVAFTDMLLDRAHVSLTPGTVFGKHGEGYVRLSLTTPDERLALAVERMQAVLPGPVGKQSLLDGAIL